MHVIDFSVEEYVYVIFVYGFCNCKYSTNSRYKTSPLDIYDTKIKNYTENQLLK